MARVIEVFEYQYGSELKLRTPGTYAMDLAVDLLQFIEAEFDAQIHNTGWKTGYGLKVSKGILIHLDILEAELETDGDKIAIRRLGGSKHVFDELCVALRARAVGGSPGAA